MMGRLRDTCTQSCSCIINHVHGPTSIDDFTMIDHHAPPLHGDGKVALALALHGFVLKTSKMCKRCNAKGKADRKDRQRYGPLARSQTQCTCGELNHPCSRSEAAVFVIGFCARQHAPLLHPSATVVRILRGYGLARSPLSLLNAPSLPPVLHQPKWLMTVRGGAFDTPGEIEGDQDGPRWLMSITAHRAWPVDFVARRRRG